MDERLWEGSPRKVHTLLFGPISFVFQQLKLSVFGGLSSDSRSSLSCNRLNLVKVLWPHLLTDVLTPLSVSADTVDLSDLFWTKADFYLNSHLQLSDRRHSVALSTVLSVVPYLALSTVLSVSSSSRPFFSPDSCWFYISKTKPRAGQHLHHLLLFFSLYCCYPLLLIWLMSAVHYIRSFSSPKLLAVSNVC